MAWQSNYDSPLFTVPFWNNNLGGMSRGNVDPGDEETLWYNTTPKTFSINKNYQFATTVDTFSSDGAGPETVKYLSLETAWGTTFDYEYNANPFMDTRPYLNGETQIYYYSNPPIETTSNDVVEYKSTYDGFGNPAIGSGTPTIKNFKLVEFDWFIQGWAVNSFVLSAGWIYEEDDNVLGGPAFKYNQFRPSGAPRRYPLGYDGSSTTPTHGFTQSNYIARFISYPTFNISFTMDVVAPDDYYIDLFLMTNLDDNLRTNNINDFNTELNNGQYLGRVKSDGDFTFYDLTGEQYLLITANNTNNGALTGQIKIHNFIIEGAYQETDNNEQFLFTNSGTYSEPTDLCIIGGSSDATYSVSVVNENTLHEQIGTPSNTFAGATGFPGFFSNLYGDVINLNFLNAKVGNGTFKAGLWENGVWNSGWRVDDSVYEFDDVEIALLMRTTNTRWRIQLTGPEESLSQFEVGNRVSIGNIVGIDINENRKLMKNYFTILSKTTNTMVVDFNNTFPLRRIEKDSENHKILVSKNIWLNGGFLNGYFEGIWNNGLFRGFPYITEMYNTHWIDGKYDGGHFYGEYPEYTYVDTYWWNDTAPNTLGLTFGATAHGLKIGDLVKIDKDNKFLNPQYDGDATVIEVVDDYLVIVDKQFGASSILEGGTIARRTGTAVIQNFEFYDNNVAKRTTLDTTNLQAIYKYNSWVDVKWLNDSASNLGRTQVIHDPLWGEYVQNNLYGHITEDVLDSVSSFRNSHDLNKTIYSLGTKYNIYEDFLGESSEFNEPFGANNQGLDNFYNNGWTTSSHPIYGPTGANLDISRDDESESLKIEIPQATFGIFNLDNTNVTIDKNRYSIIEFDLNSFLASTDVIFGLFPSLYLLNTISIPGGTEPAFPDQEYVFHTRTESVRKYEYFYNRRGLDILLLNGTGLTASFDNVKIYEIDKIPFFKYVTYDYINKSVQVPYQGIAPFIDYSDNEFSFIDNIDIGLDSLSTVQSTNPPVGGGGDVPLGIFDDAK